jgi:hypothetical protein
MVGTLDQPTNTAVTKSTTRNQVTTFSILNAPYAWRCPTYGQTTQLPFPKDTTARLSAAEISRIQQTIVGTLLYYAQAVDVTLLVALNTLASKQTKSTKNTASAIIQLLYYCSMHQDATIHYHASEMAIHIDSDASYLSMPKA